MQGKTEKENKKFLQADDSAVELFRVLISSDRYDVSQMKFGKNIQRAQDPDGDKYISSELEKFNKIDEVVEGVLSIGLFPDSGRIMKIRPIKPTYLIEIDKLIGEDIRRWGFKFSGNIINPTTFNIKYRVVLRKQQSDDEIIREVQQKMLDKQ